MNLVPCSPFLILCGLIGIGGITYFASAAIFRPRVPLFKRVVSFGAGLLSLVYGGVIAIFMWPMVSANNGSILFFSLPLCLLLLGFYVLPMSVFGSDERIEKLFGDIAGRFRG